MEQAAQPTIAMTPIESSNIAAHGYDEASKTLAIQFKGGSTYHYAGVEPAVASEFAGADSKGSFFAKSLRSQFTGTKITPEADKQD